MDSIEASGRTLEEAIETAAQQLGVSAESVAYELVEAGAKGFLGLGQTPTTIKAWVREDQEEVSQTVAVAAEPAALEEAEEKIEETEAVSAPAEAPEASEESSQSFAENLVHLLTDILEAMGVDARPELRSADDEEVKVDIVGKDVAILIGKRGQTLDSLQYLAGIAANRCATVSRRVVLDAEGYRERHKEMLERTAFDYARAVKSEGKEAVLEPQPARDRRIIHLALADDPDVFTYSEGEGEDRHVVISPKK